MCMCLCCLHWLKCKCFIIYNSSLLRGNKGNNNSQISLDMKNVLCNGCVLNNMVEIGTHLTREYIWCAPLPNQKTQTPYRRSLANSSSILGQLYCSWMANSPIIFLRNVLQELGRKPQNHPWMKYPRRIGSLGGSFPHGARDKPGYG